MKKVLFVLLAFLFLVVVVAGVLLMLREEPEPVSPGKAGDPFGSLTGGSQVRTPMEGITLALRDGSTVLVPDFTHENQPEWAGEASGYRVAGEANESYSITYIPADDQGAQAQFLVRILAEPIGEVRRAAEQELLTKLRVNQVELCELDVQVWVTDDVNEGFAGRDLRPSFCPGAVKLP